MDAVRLAFFGDLFLPTGLAGDGIEPQTEQALGGLAGVLDSADASNMVGPNWRACCAGSGDPPRQSGGAGRDGRARKETTWRR